MEAGTFAPGVTYTALEVIRPPIALTYWLIPDKY